MLGSTLCSFSLLSYSLYPYFYWVLVFPFLYFLSVSESRPFVIRAANIFFSSDCHLSAAFVSGSFVLREVFYAFVVRLIRLFIYGYWASMHRKNV